MQPLRTTVRNLQQQQQGVLHHLQQSTGIMISTPQEAIPELDVDRKVTEVKKVNQGEMA